MVAVITTVARAGLVDADPTAPTDPIDAIAMAAPGCDAALPYCFQIVVHVAHQTDNALVAGPDWIAAQLATANRQFAALDVGFQIAKVDTLPNKAARIATRAERTSLASATTGPAIHVFVTAQLDDIDKPGGVIRGVTWHATDHKFVILSTLGGDRVLAHELGHVFGLPHSGYAISIMNKAPREQPPQDQRRFADAEISIMKTELARLVRDRVIANVKRAP
jgi:hypothetical protein